MPRKRTEIDREDKIAEIVVAAQGQLADGGYGRLSLKAIARELGVAQSAIYWYFPTKDHLFVGAIQELFLTAWARKPRRATLTRQVQWFADEVAMLHPYITALRTRAEDSEVAAEFVTTVETQLRSILSAALPARTGRATATDAADVILALIEGLAAQGVTKRRRDRLLSLALTALAEAD